LANGKATEKVHKSIQAEPGGSDRGRSDQPDTGSTSTLDIPVINKSLEAPDSGWDSHRSSYGTGEGLRERAGALQEKGRRADLSQRFVKKNTREETKAETVKRVGRFTKDAGSIKEACRVSKVPRSTYYYRLHTMEAEAERDKRDMELKDKIEEIKKKHSQSGYRTMQEYLFRKEELWVNHKRLQRVMNKYDLQGYMKKAFVTTTDSNHDLPIYPNLLPEMYVDDIDQVWVSDITYIRIATGFVYLAVILDVFSRRVIGWALSRRIDHKLTCEALRSAIEARRPGRGCIHHSDQGVQYACKEYIEILKGNEFHISMSRRGNPYDNAFAESFFKTLKSEEVYLWEYETYDDVLERIPEFIEAVYNCERVHSSIGYLPPAEFEDLIKNGINAMKTTVGQGVLIL